MPNARVTDIVSQVRLFLGQVGVSNLQDGEIHRVAKRVIRQLMIELKPIELSFDVTLVEDQEAYDISDEATLDIKALIPSWDDSDVKYVDNIKYKEYATTGNTYPYVCTLFNRKLYFRPIPGQDDDVVTVWAYQTEPKTSVDADTAPETPEYLDDALILGICAQYNRAEFREEYEIEKNRWKGTIHKKINQTQTKNLGNKGRTYLV